METAVARVHPCTTCSSVFLSQNGLNQHIMNCNYMYTYQPWYHLEVTGTRGSTASSLYSCQFCNDTFFDYARLCRHLSTHRETKPPASCKCSPEFQLQERHDTVHSMPRVHSRLAESWKKDDRTSVAEKKKREAADHLQPQLARLQENMRPVCSVSLADNRVQRQHRSVPALASETVETQTDAQKQNVRDCMPQLQNELEELHHGNDDDSNSLPHLEVQNISACVAQKDSDALSSSSAHTFSVAFRRGETCGNTIHDNEINKDLFAKIQKGSKRTGRTEPVVDSPSQANSSKESEVCKPAVPHLQSDTSEDSGAKMCSEEEDCQAFGAHHGRETSSVPAPIDPEVVIKQEPVWEESSQDTVCYDDPDDREPRVVLVRLECMKLNSGLRKKLDELRQNSKAKKNSVSRRPAKRKRIKAEPQDPDGASLLPERAYNCGIKEEPGLHNPTSVKLEFQRFPRVVLVPLDIGEEVWQDYNQTGGPAEENWTRRLRGRPKGSTKRCRLKSGRGRGRPRGPGTITIPKGWSADSEDNVPVTVKQEWPDSEDENVTPEQSWCRRLRTINPVGRPQRDGGAARRRSQRQCQNSATCINQRRVRIASRNHFTGFEQTLASPKTTNKRKRPGGAKITNSAFLSSNNSVKYKLKNLIVKCVKIEDTDLWPNFNSDIKVEPSQEQQNADCEQPWGDPQPDCSRNENAASGTETSCKKPERNSDLRKTFHLQDIKTEPSDETEQPSGFETNTSEETQQPDAADGPVSVPTESLEGGVRTSASVWPSGRDEQPANRVARKWQVRRNDSGACGGSPKKASVTQVLSKKLLQKTLAFAQKPPSPRKGQADGTGCASLRCPRCDKTFQWIAHLRRHMQVHEQEKPYKCKNCPSSYKYYDGLERHRIRRLCRKQSPTSQSDSFSVRLQTTNPP